jgi:hypothetical protein
MSEDFDIDAGVANIAESMGLSGGTDKEEIEATESTETPGNEGDGEPVEEAVEESPENEPIDEIKVKAAPSSWAKDKHETWNGIPDDAKEYIELREQQMLDGIQQYRDGFQYAQYIDQAISPYREVIQASGGDEATAIINLFEHHKAITEGSLEKRQQAFIDIGIATGLIPRENAQKVDPMVSQLQQEINAIKQKEQQRQAQHESRVRQETLLHVEQFSKDKPDFHELSDSIAEFIKIGHTLESAYEQAKWANPNTRSAEIERINAERTAKHQQEAIKAKKSSAINIKPSMSQGKPNSPVGTWDDTMQETLARLKQKA